MNKNCYQRRVVLTESQIRNCVKQIVKTIIKESEEDCVDILSRISMANLDDCEVLLNGDEAEIWMQCSFPEDNLSFTVDVTLDIDYTYYVADYEVCGFEFIEKNIKKIVVNDVQTVSEDDEGVKIFLDEYLPDIIENDLKDAVIEREWEYDYPKAVSGDYI